MTYKILDANDKAVEESLIDKRVPYSDHRGRLLFDWNILISPILTKNGIPKWNGVEGEENPVTAFIESGRWLARCQCGCVEYVTPKDKIFFCHDCGNKDTGGKSKPVIFPTEREINAIESAMMKRELVLAKEDFRYPPTHQARNARYVTKPREWHPRGK